MAQLTSKIMALPIPSRPIPHLSVPAPLAAKQPCHALFARCTSHMSLPGDLGVQLSMAMPIPDAQPQQSCGPSW